MNVSDLNPAWVSAISEAVSALAAVAGLFIGIAGVVVAGVFGYLTWRTSMRATDAEQRSAILADQSGDEAERERERDATVASLLAAMRSVAGGEPRTPPAEVSWRLLQTGKDQWAVENVGNATAFNVSVDGLTDADKQDVMQAVDDPMDLSPGDRLPFYVARSFGSPPVTTISINWRDSESGPDRFTRRNVV